MQNKKSRTMGKRMKKGDHSEIFPSDAHPPVKLRPGLVNHMVKTGFEKKPVFRYFG